MQYFDDLNDALLRMFASHMAQPIVPNSNTFFLIDGSILVSYEDMLFSDRLSYTGTCRVRSGIVGCLSV